MAVVLSGYVLSNAASNLIDEFGISDVLGGVVILFPRNLNPGNVRCGAQRLQ